MKVDDSKTLKNRIKKAIQKCPWLFDKVQIVVRKNRYNKLKKDIPFYGCYLAQKEGRELPEL